MSKLPPPPGEASAPSGFRSDAALAALAGMAVLAVAVLTLVPQPIGMYVDDGIYAILGKALAAGEGLRYLNLPGQPAATHFPPGYPLFLSFLWRLAPSFPQNTTILVLANAVLLGSAAAFCVVLARGRLAFGRSGAAIAALIGTAASPALLFVSEVLSETLFLAILLPTLWAAERALDEPTAGRVVGAAVLAGALALTRTLGLVVLPAAALLLLLRRARWQALLLMAIGLIVVGPWQMWTAAHSGALPAELAGNYGAYGPWLAQAVSAEGPGFLARVALRNARAMGLLLEPGLAPWLPDLVRGGLGVAALAVVGVGARAAWRRAPVTIVSLAAYLAVVLVWPFPPFRFLWAVSPLLVLLGAVGVRVLIAWRPVRPAWRPLGLALVACALFAVADEAFYVGRSVTGADSWSNIPRIHAPELVPVLRWTVRHAAPGDLLVTEPGFAQSVFLYTGRRALPASDPRASWYLTPPTREERADYLARLLTRFDVRYVLVSEMPAYLAATRLSEGPSPRLRFVEPLDRYGAVFAVVRPAQHAGE